MNPPEQSPHHIWKFFRSGGTDQVRLETAADLSSLEQLDQKLWVALSCPTRGLEIDPKTLDLLDTDKDGRIRVREILTAVQWTAARLKNLADIKHSSEALPLAAINDTTEEGKPLLASARQILRNLGKETAGTITLTDTLDTTRIFEQTKFNGDSIVPVESAPDEQTKAVILEIITTLGGELDRSGKPGIGQVKTDLFFSELQAFSAWWKLAEDGATAIMPLGGATAAAAGAIRAVRAKLDDYFTRCRLAAFDYRATAPLNRAEVEFVALAAKDFSASAMEVAGFPVARIEADKPLLLTTGINPAWTGAIAKLLTDAVTPVFGQDKLSLTADEWVELQQKFAAHEAWLAVKAGARVESLGLARVREILAGTTKEVIATLIAQDKALEIEFNAITMVERLIRYHRDLYQLLNNYVSFADFYGRKRKAIFQAGTLYLDGRSCDLCLRVEDAGKHGALANLSRTFLAYCECQRRATGEKMTIAAAFTDGGSDDLIVGRNGLFYDRKGQDWDATIVKVVDHPISIRQAFWSPYRRIGRMVEEQIEKFAASRDKAVTDQAASNLDATAKAAAEGKASTAAPVKKIDPGMLAAVGIVTTGLISAISTIVAPLMGLPWWNWPFVVLGVMLLVSLPSMIIATIKLRKRNLGPLLDANGWAVNSKVKLNIPFGGSLTSVAKLPANSQRDLTDLYAEDDSTRKQVLALVAVVVVGLGLWYFGALRSVLPGLPKSGWVKNIEAMSGTGTVVVPAMPAK